MFCEKCGSRLEEDARFCTLCGYQVQPLAEEQVTDTIPEPEVEVVQEPASTPLPEPVAEVIQEPASTPLPEPVAEVIQEPASTPLPGPAVQYIPMQPEQWQGQMQYGQYPVYAPNIPRKKMEPKTKKLIFIISAAIVVAAAALIVFLIISGHPINRFKGFLQAEEYGKAADLYAEEISGNSDLEDSAYQILQEFVDNVKTQFVSEAISYKEAINTLDDIREMEILDVEDIIDTYTSISDLNDSRTAFAEGESLFEKQDYAGAISQYQKVIRDDANYDKAQQQIEAATEAYRSDILEQADSLMASDSYDQALGVLNGALTVLPGDSAITQKITDCSNAKTDYIRTQALSDAQLYASQNNYQKAFDTLNSALVQLPDDAQIKNALNGYQEDFVEKALGDAETAFGSSQDSEAALLVLNNALAVLPGNQTLLNKVYYYDSFNVWIDELTYSYLVGNIDYNTFTRDSDNNEYTHSYSIDSSSVDIFYAEYTINGEYRKFEGVCAIPSEFAGTYMTKYFEIYGDGKLLFTSNTMTGDAAPQPFSIDITGVKVLRIQYPATDWYNRVATIFDGKLIK